MSFQTYNPIDGTKRLSPSALGVPPGTAVDPQVAELLRDIVLQLRLPEAGVTTPWGTRVGDMKWEEIEHPDTNIASFRLTDAKIKNASTALFGQQLPFITVMTGELQMASELKRILEGSDYELFETQGVYSQDDPDPIPNIRYLHWLRVLDLADQPTRNVKPMEQVAREMHGTLLFSQQVPVEGTTSRQPPAISFEDAFNLQEPAPIDVVPGDPGAPTFPSNPGVPDQQPPPSEQLPAPVASRASLAGPVLLGLGILGATIVVGRRMRK